ncbi:MAG: hypothetical protein HY659_01515 [Rhizobiales bacterium]|nr:hypothetical protein [Hyphomicrobiales bacterium]
MTLLMSEARKQMHPHAFTGMQIAVLLFLMLLLMSTPIWTQPVPPLSDYINHLARMHVIATINKDPYLGRFYAIDWQIIPNLTMDLIIPPLMRVVSIYHAGQIFLVTTFALIMSGTLTLNRALFGRWSVLPLAAFPLLYNYVFLTGLVNYMFGIGLALWALACWIMLRERHWFFRFAISTLFVAALFFCHLSALGIYGVGLLATESLRLWSRRNEPAILHLVDFIATGVPFILIVPLLLYSPTLQLALDYSWEPRGKIDGLIYVIQAYSDIVTFALITIVAGGATWARRRRLLHIHPIFWPLLAISALVYLLMPRIMFATYMADQRLPLAFVFMLIACIDIDLRRQIARRGFLVLVIVVLLVRVIEVNVSWAELSRPVSEFRASIKRIKPGSKVLVAYAERNAGEDVSELGLVHAACGAMIERSALVSTAFAVKGKQILRVRSEYQDIVDTEDGTPPLIEQLIVAADRPSQDKSQYWHMWPSRYDYLYILFTETDAPNPDPDHLTLLQDGTRFQLYRIGNPK